MARQRQDQLDARQALASSALRRNLAATEARLYAELESVTDLILSTPVEKRSPAWLYQQARYRELIAQVDQEMAAYGGEAARQITDAQRWAQQQGLADAAALGAQAAGVRAGDFLGTNMANLSAVAGFMVDGTPLSAVFATYGPSATREARQVLSNALTFGWGSAKTAREFRGRVVGMPARRAELIARTELHRVYRSTSRDVYAANSDVLTGWVWLAKLDSRTCVTCISMSGTMHPLEETLDGHPRCRCAMVPITGPWQAIDPRLAELKHTTAQVPTGADWLRAQPPATQKAVLGTTKYDLYKRGQIDLQDLVVRDSHPDWGTMRREATIAEARAAAAARGVRQTFPRKPGKTAAQLRAEREAVKAKMAKAKAAQPAIPTGPVKPYTGRPVGWTRTANLQGQLDAVANADRAVKYADELVAKEQGRLEFYLEREAKRRVELDEYAKTELVKHYSGAELKRETARLIREDPTLAKMLEMQVEVRASLATATDMQKLARQLADDFRAHLDELRGLPVETLDWIDSLPLRGVVADPLADAKLINQKWLTDEDYQNNCTRCAAAYEMRERGYDVVAGGTPTGEIDSVIERMWVDGTGESRKFDYLDSTDAVLREAESWGPGARGMVVGQWRNGGGHIWNVQVNEAGKAYYVETQNLQSYRGVFTGDDLNANYARDLADKGVKTKTGYDSKGVGLMRVDDMWPSSAMSSWVQTPV